jgi:hypothetical protein
LEDDGFHDCRACRQDGLQQNRGCPELSLEHPHILFEMGDEVIRHCLVGRVTSQSLTWIEECNYIEAGILPEAGGLNNQYEIDLRAFSIIQGERALKQSEQ